MFVGVYKAEAHVFSLYLLIPYIGVTVPLLYYNWYVWCVMFYGGSQEHLLPSMGLRFNSYEYGLIIDDTLLWANIWFHQCWTFFDFDQYRQGYKLTNRLANIM